MFGEQTNVPHQGDLIWINAEPHAGHEYGGHDIEQHNIRRPMLVVSSDIYNQRTGMIVGFPITSQAPANLFTKIAVNTDNIHGYIITSNLLGYDYVARQGEIIGPVNAEIKNHALSYVKSIFDIFD